MPLRTFTRALTMTVAISQNLFRLATLAWSVIWIVAAGSAGALDEVNSPLSPQESLSRFQLEPGLAIELVACEPEVIDPIAIRFDEDGRLWVVEMRDYPHGPPAGSPPLSKIRVLTDGDGDGRFETSRTFADELLFPTGIQPWRGGVFVTLAGAVVYLKDTDGDDRADLHETWYRGFTIENPQLRANHPRLGLDGRIYIANGLRGGEVVDARDAAAEPLPISGRDFCFDPHTGVCEAISGNGQFGLALDDFGNRFVCNNRAPLQHVVLENKYLARNPFLAVASVVNDVAPAGEMSRVFPLTAAWTTSNLHAGQFTAACGIEIYRGDLLGPAYRGNAFVCEPTGSLVHREVLAPDGVTFSSRPPRDGSEFLASPDPWFRPVNLEIGPDGALYVVDMYRAVIEHPQFMPSELQQRPDLRRGDDRGRIYRVVRARTKPPRAAPHLSAASSGELVKLLEHTNAWWRETAARLLFERRDDAVKPALTDVAAGKSATPARAQALSLLAHLEGLTPTLFDTALQDDDPRLREHAIGLAESRLADDAALRRRLIAAAADNDARVRFRAALALGGLTSDDVVPALAAIALVRPDDPWTRDAIAAALPSHLSAVLTTIVRSPAMQSKTYGAPELDLARELAVVVGARRDNDDLAKVVALLGEQRDETAVPIREVTLLGLARGLERRGAALGDAMTQLPDGDARLAKLAVLFEQARADAANDEFGESIRALKLDLLAYDRTEATTRLLVQVVAGAASQTLRVRAAEALAGHTGADVGQTLIDCYPSQTPAVRRAILDTLIAHADGAERLLDEVEAGRIARNEIDTSRANRLTNHVDMALRERSKKLLAAPPTAERQAVLADYHQVLDLASDPLTGKELFRQHCAACHHIADVGVDVAPDISDSRVKTPQQLLTDILNPNQAIDNNYASFTVVMLDGSVHTGIISAETASSITLRQAENKTLDLLRTDVEAIRTSGLSLMPEGFEKQLSKQQMADLIAFIKNWRYLRK